MSNFSIPNKTVQVTDHVATGRILRAKREAKGISPTQHAARMGISSSYLNLLESGKRTWTQDRAERYLAALK